VGGRATGADSCLAETGIVQVGAPAGERRGDEQGEGKETAESDKRAGRFHIPRSYRSGAKNQAAQSTLIENVVSWVARGGMRRALP
jgi:hypothetical protein